MKGLSLTLLLALVFTGAVGISVSLALAQFIPVFKLGFKALADQFRADMVGSPVENEYFNLSNGNSKQHTAKGLMVWRKEDNWTAFTDGSRTWINGPAGVQTCLNNERFRGRLAVGLHSDLSELSRT